MSSINSERSKEFLKSNDTVNLVRCRYTLVGGAGAGEGGPGGRGGEFGGTGGCFGVGGSGGARGGLGGDVGGVGVDGGGFGGLPFWCTQRHVVLSGHPSLSRTTVT